MVSGEWRARTDAVSEPGARTLEAREEEVRVRKRPVQTGEAEVYKEVRTESRSIDVPVKKATEEVTVGKRATEDEEHIDTTVRKEDIRVDKRPRRDTRPPQRSLRQSPEVGEQGGMAALPRRLGRSYC